MPEICFLSERLTWTLLFKNGHGDSLCGRGLNTQASNWGTALSHWAGPGHGRHRGRNKVRWRQRRIFIFGALGYFKLVSLLEGLRRLMSYKLALCVVVTFIEQVVPIHKHITLFWIPSISGTKTVTVTRTKRQQWSYVTTLPLYIYWVPYLTGLV